MVRKPTRLLPKATSFDPKDRMGKTLDDIVHSPPPDDPCRALAVRRVSSALQDVEVTIPAANSMVSAWHQEPRLTMCSCGLTFISVSDRARLKSQSFSDLTQGLLQHPWTLPSKHTYRQHSPFQDLNRVGGPRHHKRGHPVTSGRCQLAEGLAPGSTPWDAWPP
jgi:hypothetical protein